MTSPRDEAERLVAAALAALSVAAKSTEGFATGSAECCVCPLCKAIAAAREPDTDFAERLASGMGDLATGLAGVLRAFGAPAGPRPAEPRPAEPRPAEPRPAGPEPASDSAEPRPAGPGPAGEPAAKENEPAHDDVWHSATRGTAAKEPDETA
jgi:hypothetical protein